MNDQNVTKSPIPSILDQDAREMLIYRASLMDLWRRFRIVCPHYRSLAWEPDTGAWVGTLVQPRVLHESILAVSDELVAYRWESTESAYRELTFLVIQEEKRARHQAVEQRNPL